MILSEQNSDVVVVGAGLSGLMMAAQLLRYGVRPTILDQRSAPEDTPEPVAIRAQTLEIFRQLGLDIDVSGFEIEGITIQHKGSILGNIRLDERASAPSKFPTLQIVSRDRLEQQLIHYLTVNTCPIYWNVSLLDVERNADFYTLSLEVDKQIHHALRCSWLIGADGQHSAVRRSLHVPLDADKKHVSYFTSDVQINESHNQNLHLFLSENGFVSIAPIDGKGNYRIAGNMPPKWADRNDYASIDSEIQALIGFELPVEGNPALRRKPVEAKMAADFYKHRSFLIGSAAHSAHPLTADSMDQAIHDAHNLAWKLAYCVKGKQSPVILNTYTGERKYIVQRAFESSVRLSRILQMSGGIFGYIRTRLIRHAIRKGNKSTTVDHKNSPLSVHLSMGKKIQAGERLPYRTLYHEKEQKQTDLHAWCQKPGFILLILGNVSQNHLFILAQWMQQKYAPYMHLFYLPYSKQNEAVFQAFEVKEDKLKMVLIRPDMYIAYMHDTVSANLIDTYMVEVMQWRL